ncbi:FAD:protein FMN transferase [Luteimonas salinilitoris]|uniref:FAD:protein FMN transferase n=1 Tax=Luteimonas salinilitoris TaxID=3237697 RepID=A0ABV4HV29_9GAMM
MSTIAIASDRFPAMGTRVELHLFGRGASAALRPLREVIERIEVALTMHRESPTTRLNAQLAARREALIEEPLLREAIAVAMRMHALTDGLFDVASTLPDGGGPVRGGLAHARLDADGMIHVERQLSLDFGGLGKGLALDHCAGVLAAHGIGAAIVSLGESSILAWGTHPHGECWPLSVPHPFRPDQPLQELQLRDAAISISSTIANGASSPSRAPIVRPAGGAAVTMAATAIVVHRSGARAEALSTAALIATPQERESLAAQAALSVFECDAGGQACRLDPQVKAE